MTVRRLRERAGFDTVAALAAEAKQNESTVTKIEAGMVPDPRVSTVQALAVALGVSTDDMKKAIDGSVRAKAKADADAKAACDALAN